MQRTFALGIATATLVGLLAGLALRPSTLQAQTSQQPTGNQPVGREGFDLEIAANVTRQFEEGRRIFRYDTFGDEAWWGDQLRLHQAIAGEKNGGVGPGVSPKTALAVGLKVDAQALPASVVEAIKAGQVNLDDPGVTVTLLKLDAVLGVKGFFDAQGNIRSIGIQCALCHSTVDDSFAPGIGRRLDGWASRDLNIGAIIALAPNLKPYTDALGVDDATLRKVLNSWGPGKFDARVFLDGIAFQPDGKPAATLMGAAFGLAGVNQNTTTGAWGTMNYWNALVANLLMHGKGTFIDARLNNATQYPIATKAGAFRKRDDEDLITSKLGALQIYQMSIPPPKPPAGSFNEAAAARGATLFEGKAQCATCHVPPLFTEPGDNLHSPAEIGIDDFQANRAPTRQYRTTPLRGLWTHAKGGFFHDGRFTTLLDVVNHYNTFFNLSLSDGEKNDLVEYLKSL